MKARAHTHLACAQKSAAQVAENQWRSSPWNFTPQYTNYLYYHFNHGTALLDFIQRTRVQACVDEALQHPGWHTFLAKES